MKLVRRPGWCASARLKLISRRCSALDLPLASVNTTVTTLKHAGPPTLNERARPGSIGEEMMKEVDLMLTEVLHASDHAAL